MKLFKRYTELTTLGDNIHIDNDEYELVSIDFINKKIELIDLNLPTKHVLEFIDNMWFCCCKQVYPDEIVFKDDQLVYEYNGEINIINNARINIDHQEYNVISLCMVQYDVDAWTPLEERYIDVTMVNNTMTNGFIAIDKKGNTKIVVEFNLEYFEVSVANGLVKLDINAL